MERVPSFDFISLFFKSFVKKRKMSTKEELEKHPVKKLRELLKEKNLKTSGQFMQKKNKTYLTVILK